MAAVNVAKGLYMGGQEALEQLDELKITHVLSAVNYNVTPPAGREHMAVDLEDDESANLLEKLPPAMAWLEAALRQKGARVLVHCHAGTSRSAAVVAALIMKAKQLEPYEALVILRRACPHAAPNAGFLSQLGVWADMGWRLDARHPSYKAFLLEQVARQWEEEGYVDPCTFAELPTDDSQLQASLRYRCRKCRKVVALESNVVPPGSAAGRRAFRGQRRPPAAADGAEQQPPPQQQPGGGGGGSSGGGGRGGDGESSIFLEPMTWMEGSVVGGPTQGKLYCHGCGARLGSFNWAGISNTSGAWVTPGFQLHLSRLDEVRPRGAGPGQLPGLRLPALLAERRALAAAEAGDLLSDLAISGGGNSSGGGAGGDTSDPSAAPAAPGAAVAGTQDSGVASEPYFRYLVLDCDGVLVDTERASCGALHLAILEVTGLEIPHQFPEDYREVFGMDVAGCIEHYKARHGRDDWTDVAAIAAKVQEAKEVAYQRLTAGGISAFEGAAELIREAKALGMGVAVASSGAPSKIARNLGSSGLAPLLDPDLIVSAAYVQRGKPAPDVYLEALRRLGAESPAAAARALVLEDAIHGLTSARAAGAKAVAVATSLPADVLEPHADAVVGRIWDLVGRLAGARIEGGGDGRVVLPAAAAAAGAAAEAAAEAAALVAA